MRRTIATLLLAALPAATQAPYPIVRPGISMTFPADHGAHPEFRTEWWYVTGWLKGENGRDIGFQITFFRVNPHAQPGNPSRFSPGQLLFAHAAVSDSAVGHILHSEQSARAGFGLASAASGDADIRLLGWAFRRQVDNRFTTRIEAKDFALHLMMDPRQPPMLEGAKGYSQKGPRPEQASYYYSVPHLRSYGTIKIHGRTERVTGEAWLDREWSSSYLAPDAVGWDWTGLNFDDGGALMAFRIRRQDGGSVWSGGSYRAPDGSVTRLASQNVNFMPLRIWRSAQTGATYPVSQQLRVALPSGIQILRLQPLFADQEIDGRAAGQPVYWEGAVTASHARGYLELTGYADPLKM